MDTSITVRKPPDGGVAARRGRPGPHAALALTVAAALIGFLAAGVLRSRDPLRRAWRAAVTVGHYRMQGETRWQSGTQRDVWQVEGVGRLDGRLAVTLTQASDAPHAKPLALSIAWPDLRLAAPFESLAAPDPHAMARALPGGDPLALLAVGQGVRAGPTEAVGWRDCRVWDFQVGGAAYLDWWRAHPAFLPVNVDTGGMATFQAQLRLWQDPATQLPCRLVANLSLPRVAGEQTAQAWLDWRYEWTTESAAKPATPPSTLTLPPR